MVDIQTSLAGRYNVSNWLAAIAAAQHFGASLEDARRAASEFRGVPGRLELLPGNYSFRVYVDFAHTPQALAATLGQLRRFTQGRLIALFGQAGRRDSANRTRMAESVARHADLAIVTSDDPYDESPEVIVDDIAAGLEAQGWHEEREFWKVVDRRQAINFAMGLAQPGDVVLLAGRGPEDFTTIGQQKIEMRDADVARDAIGKRLMA
jgi:UDP-N-acetylmuramoyl-L-alanyl-D-glutamate--2,6-diaminopimelate ligase